MVATDRVLPTYVVDAVEGLDPEIHSIKEEESFEIGKIDARVAGTKTRHLFYQVDILLLPTPELSDKEMWEEEDDWIGPRLSAKGIAKLRSDIRQDT